MKPLVLFKKLSDRAVIPAYQTAGAAGMDLASAVWVSIPPRGRALVDTHLAIAIPDGFEGQVRPRSGLAAKKGLSVLNTPGTIDSDYRGEIKVILVNHGNEEVEINVGDRIAQLVIAPVVQADIDVVEELEDTERGAKGFGSTGT